MILLSFIFEDKEVHWLAPVERFLQRIGSLEAAEVLIALSLLLGFAFAYENHTEDMLVYGVALGLLTYLLVNGLGELFSAASDEDEEEAGVSGGQVVLYRSRCPYVVRLPEAWMRVSVSMASSVPLRLPLTPSSLRSVSGLVPCMFVRSRSTLCARTLQEYIYLEHGAHWAIGSACHAALYQRRASHSRGDHRPDRRSVHRCVVHLECSRHNRLHRGQAESLAAEGA